MASLLKTRAAYELGTSYSAKQQLEAKAGRFAQHVRYGFMGWTVGIPGQEVTSPKVVGNLEENRPKVATF